MTYAEKVQRCEPYIHTVVHAWRYGALDADCVLSIAATLAFAVISRLPHEARHDNLQMLVGKLQAQIDGQDLADREPHGHA